MVLRSGAGTDRGLRKTSAEANTGNIHGNERTASDRDGYALLRTWGFESSRLREISGIWRFFENLPKC
jgi:hypothetical protein